MTSTARKQDSRRDAERLLGDLITDGDRVTRYPEYACLLCQDTGMVVTETRGLRSAARCKCSIDASALKRMAKAGVPQRYLNASLEGFRIDGCDPSISRAAMRVRHAMEDSTLLVEGRGLLLSGTCGTGKTHLAVSILKTAMVRWGASGRFWNTGKLLTEIRFSFGKDAGVEMEREMRRELEKVDVLVLDDLGAERGTDWASDQISQIISDRYDAGKTTHITTNYANLAPGEGGAHRLETLGDRIGARMWSRLQEMCVTVEMNGQDYRRRAAK
jgi:DNA replication protein DnaC